LCVHGDPGLRRRRRYLASFQYSFTVAALVSPAFFTTVFEVRHWLPWLVLGLVNVLAALGVRRLERIVPAPDLRLSVKPERAIEPIRAGPRAATLGISRHPVSDVDHYPGDQETD
jgi:hypothetical protein